MVGTYLTFKYVFDYQPEDIYWCTADCGWITGVICFYITSNIFIQHIKPRLWHVPTLKLIRDPVRFFTKTREDKV